MVKVYVPNLKVEFKGVRLVSDIIDLSKGLMKPQTLFWVNNVIDSGRAMGQISREVPIDGVEVVEWMQLCAADRAVFEAMAEEYNRAGSRLLSGSDDAYTPGVRVGDIRGESVVGSTVLSRRYGNVITPHGTFRVPVGGKTTIATKDLLAWAALPWCSTVQWLLTLLQWKELAKAPISERIRFGSSHGLVAPNFFKVGPRAPLPLCVMKVGITSDKPQTIKIKGRGLPGGGSVDEVYFEDEVEIDAGQNEFIYYYWGFPVAPTITLELQPEDKTETVLDYIEVYP